MKSLNRKGATALKFQTTRLDIIDHNGQPCLRSPQIAGALGYNREDRISDIYARHADEFTDSMTQLVKLRTHGGIQQVRIFSLRGAHLLGMFARTARAAEFRHWVLDVLEQETAAPPPAAPALPAPAETLTPELRHRINKKAWKLAQQNYEYHRDAMLDDVLIGCGHTAPENWQPLECRHDVLELIEVCALHLGRTSKILRIRGRQLSSMVGDDYDKVVAKFHPPKKRNDGA